MTKLERKVAPVKALDVRPARAGRMEFEVTVPAGTTIEDVLDPDYWSHAADRVQKLGSELRIVPLDFAWVVWALVVKRSKHALRLHVINQVEIGESAREDDVVRGIAVKFAGSEDRFVIYNKDRGDVIQRGLESLSDAHLARVAYLEEMGV